MYRYSVAGRCAATGAAADQAGAVLWNASTTKIIYCIEISGFSSSAVAWALQLIRTSNRGSTPGSTVTPDIDNHRDRLLAPQSGALLDLSQYITAPTVQGPAMARTHLGGVIGSAFGWVFNPPIAIPAGTGLAIANVPATASPTMDFTFIWEE